jgi:hypothetical protein
MFTWAFKFWKAKELMSQAESLSFAIYRATRETVASISLEIFQDNGRLMRGIRKGLKNLELLAQEEKDLHFSKDFLGLVTKVEQPLFGEIQASAIGRRVFMYRLLIAAFVFCEAALFYVISDFFLPGMGQLARIAMSLVVSVGAMVILGWGLEMHLKYIYASQRYAEGLIKPDILRSLNLKRFIGYGSILLGIVFLLAVSMGRIYLIEKSSPIPAHLLHNPTGLDVYLTGKMWMGVLNVVMTFVFGIILAMYKIELFTDAPLHRLYNKWVGVKDSMARIIRDLADRRAQIIENMDVTINRGWQLVVDSQRIMQREYDQMDEELHKEYVELRSQSGFTVNHDIFTKYERLVSAFRELFDFAVQEHPHMVRFRDDMKAALEATMPQVAPESLSAQTTEDALPLVTPQSAEPDASMGATEDEDAELEDILSDAGIRMNGAAH